MKKSHALSYSFNQPISLIIDQGRHGVNGSSRMSFARRLSERHLSSGGSEPRPPVLALAGVEGFNPVNPKGRAFRFGSPVKGNVSL
jgi:hypothetical protein